MEITYYGHSTFKIKGSNGTVVTDPFDNYIGLILPTLNADIITVSHQHKDHNAIAKVKGTPQKNLSLLLKLVNMKWAAFQFLAPRPFMTTLKDHKEEKMSYLPLWLMIFEFVIWEI